MKRIKTVLILFLLSIAVYCILLYTLRFWHQQIVINIIDDTPQQQSVVVQLYDAKVDEHKSNSESYAMSELSSSDEVVVLKPDDCFVTMEILHAGKLDYNTQQMFDLLIGTNIDRLLDLIAQSNNNILSTDSCRTCAVDAIFKRVSKHKKLSEREMLSLQKVVANLYKFINTMQKLTNKSILTAQQYIALQGLNRSQVSINHSLIQGQRAATIAALQALQKIDMVQRQG